MNILSRLFGGPAATGHPLIKPDEYKTRFMQTKAPHTLVDVRTAQEFRGGAILGAINISLQELPQKLHRIPSDKPVVVYCRSGNRSAHAARILLQAGYTDVYDLGGMIRWTRQGLPVKR